MPEPYVGDGTQGRRLPLLPARSWLHRDRDDHRLRLHPRFDRGRSPRARVPGAGPPSSPGSANSMPQSPGPGYSCGDIEGRRHRWCAHRRLGARTAAARLRRRRGSADGSPATFWWFRSTTTTKSMLRPDQSTMNLELADDPSTITPAAPDPARRPGRAAMPARCDRLAVRPRRSDRGGNRAAGWGSVANIAAQGLRDDSGGAGGRVRRLHRTNRRAPTRFEPRATSSTSSVTCTRSARTTR